MDKRIYYIDNLRVFLTILVILHHIAMTYSSTGELWYFEDMDSTYEFTNFILTAFVFINQSFFMGLFFFLSGYFTPNAYDQKGPKLFLKDRYIRLNTPIIFYIFFLSPVIQFTAQEKKNLSFGHFYKSKILSLESIEIGPLWFVLALLIFNCMYLLVRIVGKGELSYKNKQFPKVPTLFIISFSLGILAFLVRLIFPVGEMIVGLQVSYFPSYIFLYIAGIMAYRQKWLDSIPKKTVKIWRRIALFVSPLLVIGLILLPKGNLNGGFNLQSLLYALWEPFVGIGICIVLLDGFRKYGNQTSLFTKTLSSTAYTVYIIHSLIIVVYSRILYDISLHPLLKFGIVGTLGIITCFLVATVICKIPYTKRIL
ncbi:acyltransferase family protein [Bacillus sp. TL12]|uniref:acyltransferase family protein n=1 Tax=Bacillus sp. TL12 TaxID=2894756 RepID=UPI001F5230DE|nr:acyltransferase family protein [Bacillus sp. TL12]MCI0768235.1 acyltransferase family protein [Bacillus sp. TL12]